MTGSVVCATGVSSAMSAIRVLNEPVTMLNTLACTSGWVVWSCGWVMSTPAPVTVNVVYTYSPTRAPDHGVPAE
jgi:hypothetical protein